MNDPTDQERDLVRRLDVAAAAVTARPDLAEIELGAGRVRGRRRVATGVVAAMLVAGAGGAGFGIGRSVSDGDRVSVADEPATASDPGSDAAPEARPDDEPSADTGDPAPTDPAADEPPTPDATPTPPVPPPVAADETAAPASTPGYLAPDPMELLAERTLASGVRVRLQGGQVWEQGWYEDGWTPADFCFPDREGRVTFDGAGVVDVYGLSLWRALFRGVQTQIGAAGWADGHPLRFAVVQVEPEVSEVEIRWADGLTDRVAPQAGAAVLVVEPASANDDVWSIGYELDLVTADGTTTVTGADVDPYDDPDYRTACNPPPPALPEAGEQPADPAAAERALRERFALLWDQSVPRDDKRSVLDDWTGVDAAVDAVFAGALAETASTAEHVIEEISFTSPTEAWFRYSLLTDVSNFYERYGTAALVDGEWQFARAVMCQDLALAGGSCEPDWEQIFPPSWYDRYGSDGGECYETEDGMECEAGAEPVPAIDEPAGAPVGTIAP